MSRPARDAGGSAGAGIASLVEEDVHDRVASAVRYAGWLLDRIDPARRLSRVALACRLEGIGYMPWRTRAEVAASPNRASIGFPGREAADCPPSVLSRAALLMDGARQAEDITVRAVVHPRHEDPVCPLRGEPVEARAPRAGHPRRAPPSPRPDQAGSATVADPTARKKMAGAITG